MVTLTRTKDRAAKRIDQEIAALPLSDIAINADGELEVVVRQVIERIETPGGEKRGCIRLKPASVAQHGDRAEKRWFIRRAMRR